MLSVLKYYHKNKTLKFQKCKFMMTSYEKEYKKLMQKIG